MSSSSTPPDAAAVLEQILLGGPAHYNRHQVADAAQVPLERAQRLWKAMGFADVGDDAEMFTDADIVALRVWDSLVRGQDIDSHEEITLARALAQAFARLAEWQVQLFRTFMDRDDDLVDGVRLVEELIPVVERLQSYVWRRQLTAAIGRAMMENGEELATREMVVGFADIVGFTSLTRRIGKAELAALLEDFETDAALAVTENHGRIVKNIGDEVLFVADDAADAAEIALRLTDPEREERGLPQLRIGMAYGNVLLRFGDVFGSVVNLAARLTSVARPGTVLIDREMATTLSDNDTYKLRPRRPIAVRGYPHMRSWVLRRNDSWQSLAD
ncbi:adenylate/guanylate cyclase domain-containing protein [Fodinicola acaciae]|uniref:adenylate/guanylate cyclase domain-containing protein n=1 Tax=Fodinicola acaciae TaxID=2681555 RepID=UPI0013D0B1EB|nr:adenylate/guanylate cyclase domain-containing protein [Fodinicola acaciae]